MPRREGAASLSALLEQISAQAGGEPVTVARLIDVMNERASGALIFVFAAPNVIPLPPGASTVLGAPLLFLTAQLMLGRRPWLPGFIMRRSMQRSHFDAMVARLGPWLARAESLLRPRLVFLTRPPLRNLVGAVCFALAVILFLPIPMGNMPPAIAICLFALGVLEGDGLWIVAGLAVGCAAVALVSGILFALLESGLFMLNKLFG